MRVSIQPWSCLLDKLPRPHGELHLRRDGFRGAARLPAERVGGGQRLYIKEL